MTRIISAAYVGVIAIFAVESAALAGELPPGQSKLESVARSIFSEADKDQNGILNNAEFEEAAKLAAEAATRDSKEFMAELRAQIAAQLAKERNAKEEARSAAARNDINNRRNRRALIDAGGDPVVAAARFGTGGSNPQQNGQAGVSGTNSFPRPIDIAAANATPGGIEVLTEQMRLQSQERIADRLARAIEYSADQQRAGRKNEPSEQTEKIARNSNADDEKESDITIAVFLKYFTTIAYREGTANESRRIREKLQDDAAKRSKSSKSSGSQTP
jgi:hypothetical protein